MTLIHEQILADFISQPRPAQTRAAGTSAEAVLRAISGFRAGQPVIVMSGLGADARGVLACAADTASAETIATMVRHTSGFLYACLDGATCDRLDLPLQMSSRATADSQDCVSVDASAGVSTGISARDRAHTLRLLADPDTSASAFTRPGHVVPLRTEENGVIARPALAEASIDLARLAGLYPAAAIADIVSTARTWDIARRAELLAFGSAHHLAPVTVADVVRYRWRHIEHVEMATDDNVATDHGPLRAVTFRSRLDGRGMIALLPHRLMAGQEVELTVHAECRTSSMFRTRSCACKAQLDKSLHQLTSSENRVVLYIPTLTGADPLAPCTLESAGGYADQGDVDVAAQVLRQLGIDRVRMSRSGLDLAAVLLAAGVSVRTGATDGVHAPAIIGG
jgi:3,4-dihydroxy 2-butanone 4-phosphate synthase/GTP cyclohydrolase II